MAGDVTSLLPAGAGSFHIDAYIERGGYGTARRVLGSMKPEEVVAEVKKANLRGRGGAGFPAGMKWSFVPPPDGRPRYLCVNADEGEPGTFKDRAVMTRNPHLLLEGVIIASYAVGIHRAFIYVRGEYEAVARRLEEAVEEARGKGFLGGAILGSKFGLDVVVHRGAGAYICGEETALLESLEGKRGEPRLKPPFPASVGLFGCPTVINNVETIACVPLVLERGAARFLDQGVGKDGGRRLYGVSGAVRRPGLYELPVGTSLRSIVHDHAGGPAEGLSVKAVIPGGLSAPLLAASEIDVPMDCDSLSCAGSMLGSAGIIVIGDRTSMLDVLKVVSRFYAHESCGQCTPCRVGTDWINKIVTRLAGRGGSPEDLDQIRQLALAMKGRTLCPLGDAAAQPIVAIVDKFRDELEGRIAR
jgi:NADH-quinone oxidoreductase subunit F